MWTNNPSWQACDFAVILVFLSSFSLCPLILLCQFILSLLLSFLYVFHLLPFLFWSSAVSYHPSLQCVQIFKLLFALPCSWSFNSVSYWFFFPHMPSLCSTFCINVLSLTIFLNLLQFQLLDVYWQHGSIHLFTTEQWLSGLFFYSFSVVMT